MTKRSFIETINKIIREETGIKLEQERLIDLDIVVRNRLVKNKMDHPDYIQYLKSNTKEIISLASIFTIQETCFYRNRAHFDRLKTDIIPSIIQRNRYTSPKQIRVLSAGCSTGEEPYTIAMLLNELIPDPREWKIEILGTDINLNAINQAKTGLFSEYKLRNLEAYYRQRYFDEELYEGRTHYRLRKKIREMVSFRVVNLIHEPFELEDYCNADILFCENVIIYFERESIERLISNFYTILRPGGTLFLGYSETLNIVPHNFQLTWFEQSYAYRKPEGEGDVALPLTDLPSTFHDMDADIINSLNLARNSPDLQKEILYNIFTLCEDRDVNECIQLFESLQQEFHLDEVFYVIKAEYLLDNARYYNSANECRKAICLDPGFIDPHIILAIIYQEMDMFSNTFFELKTSLYINPDSILAHYYLSRYFFRIENFKQQKYHHRKARELLCENNGLFVCRVFPVVKSKYLQIYNEIMNGN